MRGFNARLAQTAREIQVKIRRVNPDKDIRPVAQKMRAQAGLDLSEFPIAPERLADAHHGQALHGVEHPHAGGGQLAPADALDFCRMTAPAERLNEARAEAVARGLARDHADPQHGRASCRRAGQGVHLTIPRSEAAMKVLSRSTASDSCASASSFTSASFRTRPSRYTIL